MRLEDYTDEQLLAEIARRMSGKADPPAKALRFRNGELPRAVAWVCEAAQEAGETVAEYWGIEKRVEPARYWGEKCSCRYWIHSMAKRGELGRFVLERMQEYRGQPLYADHLSVAARVLHAMRCEDGCD